MTVLYVKELSGAIEPAELLVLVDPVVPVEPVEPLVPLKAKWQLEMASARIRSRRSFCLISSNPVAAKNS